MSDSLGIRIFMPMTAMIRVYYQLYMQQERQHRSSSGRNSDTIASFLLKTYQILEHPENKKIICWDKDDIGFAVIDVVAFTKEILPKYFRHSNFSSFVRQLNMYDFHKVKQDNDMLVFKNPLFCRGEQNKLRFIKRKAAKKMSGFHRRMYHNDRAEQSKSNQTYRWLKKSVESQVTHSCIFLEKSIEMLGENNQAIGSKQGRLSQFANATSDYKIDSFYQFRQDCEGQLTKTIKWADEMLQIFKKKAKAISNYSLQLQHFQKRQDEIKLNESLSMPDLC